MIGNVLNLKQLEALIWVAELGSFRKAAQHLNTTQPNISSRIAALETTLGVVLMQRGSGPLRLTDKGQDIVKAARTVLRDAEHVLEIAERPDLIDDRLRLGVTELVACTWLHEYLRRIKAVFPSLTVELTVDLSRNLDVELSANRLDLAVQTAPFGTACSGNLELGTFPYVWVASPKLSRDLKGSQSVADLLPHAILTHARHTQAYTELAEYVDKRSLPATRIVSSNSMASCVQMAADGMGVTLLPRALVAPDLAAKRLVKVDVNWMPSPLRFAARYHTETAAQFLHRSAELAVEVVDSHLEDQKS